MVGFTLIRVEYGKKDTPKELREYRLNKKGPIGTIAEFKKAFPMAEFEIVDDIDGEETQ